MDVHPPTVGDEMTGTLTEEQISSKLREVALFKGLGEADLREILRISESIRVDGGEYVFEEGERGDHFFIIVRGSIELRKASGGEQRRLAVLRAGQAFGEMALLNQTPRSASAYALGDTYMLSVSRAAFSEILGGDTLSVRLLKNLSKALWATSVRLASQHAKANTVDAGEETLSEFNRLLRARILPRVTPKVSGYKIVATTVAPRGGAGSTSWDWFVLTDGRPVFCVTKAVRGDVFAAQRLASVRLLLRAAATEAQASLGAMLTRVNRSLKAGWVDGLSGPVMVGLAALADGAAEWVEAGPITGVVARANGQVEELRQTSPPLGADAEGTYTSAMVLLEDGDHIVSITGGHEDPMRAVEEGLLAGAVNDQRDALAKVLSGLVPVPGEGEDPADVSATIVTRSTSEA